MGHPKPSDTVRDFAVQFARTVTANSQNRYDWIARIGKYSIYNALSSLAPKVKLGQYQRLWDCLK